jgi:hypothetical protein
LRCFRSTRRAGCCWSGTPVADGELSDVRWFDPTELPQITLSRLSHALLTAINRI